MTEGNLLLEEVIKPIIGSEEVTLEGSKPNEAILLEGALVITLYRKPEFPLIIPSLTKLNNKPIIEVESQPELIDLSLISYFCYKASLKAKKGYRSSNEPQT